MKFGVITLQDAPWRELVERWQRLEQLGVETIWVADHLGNGRQPEEPWFEAWSCLAALAHVTRTPRIGPLVSPMTLRNPAVLARTALTVAELSGGRLELGVGSGASAYDHGLTQVPEWSPKERAALFATWVERLVELLADERLQPKAPVPLTIAGSGPTILRLAARYADRWNTFGGFGLNIEEGLSRARRDSERLDEFCTETGRRVLRSALIGYPFVAETPWRSEQAFHDVVGRWQEAGFEEGLSRARRDNERLDELCTETGRRVLRSALIGYPFIAETPWRSEQAFHDVVGRWQEAGFEELIFYYPPDWETPEGSVEPGLFERMLGKG